MGERNLVFESFGQPRRGYGALIVYLTKRDVGETVEINRRLIRQEWERRCEVERKRIEEMRSYLNAEYFPPALWDDVFTASAMVVRRMVNGEETYSAWFPQVQPDTYMVLLTYETKAWVTISEGEVSEVDWRENG